MVYVSSSRGAWSPERPAGVEPAPPPWEGGTLPLHHGRIATARVAKAVVNKVDRFMARPSLSERGFVCMLPAWGAVAEHLARIELAHPPRQGGRLPLHHRCRTLPVGPEGLEPSPCTLRACHAASNTSSPCSTSGTGGGRTLALRIKSPLRCHYATVPVLGEPCVSVASRVP